MSRPIDLKTRAFQMGLGAMHATRAHAVMAPFTRGQGVIFTLHRVLPDAPDPFAPNRILQVTPDFLDAALTRIKASGIDLVSLDEAVRRMRTGSARRFACLTLDDGYRDNAVHAAPVFEAHGCPYTVYVPSDFAQGTGELWWVALERRIAGHVRIAITIDGETLDLACESIAEKWIAWRTIYWRLRATHEDEARRAVRAACDSVGEDIRQPCAELIMDWDELAAFSRSPLVTIGAHTISHRAIAKLGAERALEEMVRGADRLAERLGTRPRHFSFPYGDPGSAGPRDFALAEEAGFATAVTTRPDRITQEHRGALHALPRVSLNGDYQDLRYLDLFLSGAPFAVFNTLKRAA
ncbi:MAG: polysaccharide deacetylase family protein [Pseudomonadota bacterium]